MMGMKEIFQKIIIRSMKINITTKNFDLTPAIREYIQDKMDSLDKFVEEWTMTGSVEADFDAGRTTNHHNKGNIYYAEVNLKVPGKLLRAQKTEEDLHAAIDAVKEVLAEEIKEYKEKLRDNS
jgi:putative sigma-54 modulation protein